MSPGNSRRPERELEAPNDCVAAVPFSVDPHCCTAMDLADRQAAGLRGISCSLRRCARVDLAAALLIEEWAS